MSIIRQQRRVAAGGGGETLTFNASTSASSDSGLITVPSGWAVGSLVFCFWTADDSNQLNILPAAPTGLTATWYSMRNYLNSGGPNSYGIYYCVLASGDPGTQITCVNGNGTTHSQALWNWDYSGTLSMTTPFGGSDDYGGNAAPANLTLNASGGTGPLLMVAGQSARNTITTTITGYTKEDGFSGGLADKDTSLFFKYIASGSGDNDTLSFDDCGSFNWAASAYITLE